jgi:hypothetical protein
MTKRVLILVEGRTELRFVKDVLGPAFEQRQLYFFPTIINTKRVKTGPSFKGGVVSFGKFRNDLRRLLSSDREALVTTLLDFYRLPADFPGMTDRPRGTPLDRVTHVEAAMAQHFGSPPNFIPFLALHEFEAWLFSSPDALPRVMTEMEKMPRLVKIRNSVQTPEEINERPGHAPSERIAAIFPAYRKTLHGPTTAARIGLDGIRAECPHFNEWLKKLEVFAAS